MRPKHIAARGAKCCTLCDNFPSTWRSCPLSAANQWWAKKLSIVGSKSVGQCVFRQKRSLCRNQEIDVNILHAYDITWYHMISPSLYSPLIHTYPKGKISGDFLDSAEDLGFLEDNSSSNSYRGFPGTASAGLGKIMKKPSRNGAELGHRKICGRSLESFLLYCIWSDTSQLPDSAGSNSVQKHVFCHEHSACCRKCWKKCQKSPSMTWQPPQRREYSSTLHKDPP